MDVQVPSVPLDQSDPIGPIGMVSGSGAGEKREVWRARQALYGIVEERLDARFKEHTHISNLFKNLGNLYFQ